MRAGATGGTLVSERIAASIAVAEEMTLAAVTECCRLGLNDWRLFSHSSGDWKSEIKASAHPGENTLPDL